jgi:hypothetical protein
VLPRVHLLGERRSAKIVDVIAGLTESLAVVRVENLRMDSGERRDLFSFPAN